MRPCFRRPQVLAVAVAVLLAGVLSCALLALRQTVRPRPTPSDAVTDVWSWCQSVGSLPATLEPEPPESLIPFLVLKPSEPGQSDCVVGYWDLEKGTIGFEEEPLFRLEISGGSPTPKVRLFWDGGRRLGIAASAVCITSPRSGYQVEVLSPSPLGNRLILDQVRCPSESPEILVLGPGALEIHGAPGVQGAVRRVELPLAGRPVDLSRDAGTVEVIVQAVTEEHQVQLHKLVLSDGKVIDEAVSPDLGVIDAGPGARLARVGRRVYVAVGPNLQCWDSAGGSLTVADLESGLLASYERAYASEVEFPVPPSLFGYRDTLIIEYRPAAVVKQYDAGGSLIGQQQIPNAYFVAVRGDRVLGEAVLYWGHLAVRRDGLVTQEADLPPEFWAYWWFPGSGTGP